MGLFSRTSSPPADLHCSYCNKRQAEVRKLIAGPGPIHICDECIGLPAGADRCRGRASLHVLNLSGATS
jgi:hypothetical protein